MVQRQQFQVILGALCVLVCLVCWEKSQWTQPARSDLLHNLPLSAHHANLSTSDISDPDGSHSGSTNAWSCKHSNAWFQDQEHRWPELKDLANTYCQLELSSEPEASGILYSNLSLSLHNRISCTTILTHAVQQLLREVHADDHIMWSHCQATADWYPQALTGILAAVDLVFQHSLTRFLTNTLLLQML